MHGIAGAGRRIRPPMCRRNTASAAIVGTNYFTVGLKPPTSGECVPAAPSVGTPSKCAQARVNVPVFNVKPKGSNSRRRAVGGRVPDHDRGHVHRRRPRPDESGRDLQGHRHRVADRRRRPGGRLATGLQRPRRRRHLPDDAVGLHGRRRSDDDPESRLARRTAENRHAGLHHGGRHDRLQRGRIRTESRRDIDGSHGLARPGDGRREHAVQPKPHGNGKLAPARRESRPPRRHQPQPVGRERSRDLQRRPVREGNRQPDPVPRRFENRQRRRQIPGPRRRPGWQMSTSARR